MKKKPDEKKEPQAAYLPPEAMLAEEDDDELPLYERVMPVVKRVLLVVASIMLVIGTALMIFASYFGQTRFLRKLPAFVHYLLTGGLNRTPQAATFDDSLLNPNQKKNPEFPKFKEDAAMMAYYRDGLLDDNFLELLYIEKGGAVYRDLCTAADLGILSDASFEIIIGEKVAAAAARYVGARVDEDAPEFTDGLTPRRRAAMIEAAAEEAAANSE